MKAHIGFSPNKAQREEVDKYVRQIVSEEEAAYMRRVIKVICYTLHNDFGWGVGRLVRLINAANDTMGKMQSNDTIWDSIDHELQYLGLAFEDEDYDERMQKARELRKRR